MILCSVHHNLILHVLPVCTLRLQGVFLPLSEGKDAVVNRARGGALTVLVHFDIQPDNIQQNYWSVLSQSAVTMATVILLLPVLIFPCKNIKIQFLLLSFFSEFFLFCRFLLLCENIPASSCNQPWRKSHCDFAVWTRPSILPHVLVHTRHEQGDAASGVFL